MRSEGITTVQQEVDELPRRQGLVRKLALLVPIGLLALYLLEWVMLVPASGGVEGLVRRTDFVSTLTGASVISEGHGAQLYDLPTQHDAQVRVLAPRALGPNELLPYNHLPFEALFISLFMGQQYADIFGIWTLLMAVAVGLALRIMLRALPVPREFALLMVLAAISYQPLARSFMLGQNTPLVLLGLCGTYAALKRGREDWAGLALLLVALKPQVLPVVLLVVLLQRRWRALAVFAGVLAALCLAAMLVLGAEWPVQYARLLLGVANWGDTGAIDPAIMHNWRGFATDLLGWWAPGLVTPAFLVLTLASIALLYFGFWWPKGHPDFGFWPRQSNPKSKIQNPKLIDWLWALTGIVAVVTSIHLNPHDLSLLIFPAWIIGAYALSGAPELGPPKVWLAIIWVGYALMPVTFHLEAATQYPGLAVVPNVLLMALAAVLLARAITVQSPKPRIGATDDR